MALKGFYFSLDAVLGLAVIAVALSFITIGVDTGLSESDIRFSSYSSQSVDMGHLMQQEKIGDLPEEDREDLFDNTEMNENDSNRSIANTLLVLEEQGDDYVEEMAEKYSEDFEYSSGLYYRNNSDLETLHESSIDTASSSSFVATGEQRPYEVVVVVGE